MPPRPTILRKDMRSGTIDGTLYSVMVGMGESYLVAFALAAGLSERAAGLLNPVPQLVGAALGLLLPALLIRVGSIRRVTVALVTIQSIALLALAAIALTASRGDTKAVPAPFLFTLAGLYWTAGLAAGPVWNVWATSIYPRAIRARYFGSRTRLQHLGTITGLVVAGLILGRGAADRDEYLWAYTVLFGVAGLARLGSAFFLSRQSEPQPVPPDHQHVTTKDFIAGFKNDEGGRLLILMLSLTFAVAVCGPFFAPFMLGRLEFTYTEFMTLIAINFLAKSLCLPTIGKLAKSLGPHRLLRIGAFGIVPLASLWLVSQNFWWLLAVNALSGALWACYELSTFLLLFESIPPGRRVGLLARFNLFNAAALAAGAAIGATILTAFDQSTRGYLTLFALSTALRFLAAPLCLRVATRPIRVQPLPLRPLSVGAGASSRDTPILAALDDEGDDEEDDEDEATNTDERNTPTAPTPPPASARTSD